MKRFISVFPNVLLVFGIALLYYAKYEHRKWLEEVDRIEASQDSIASLSSEILSFKKSMLDSAEAAYAKRKDSVDRLEIHNDKLAQLKLKRDSLTVSHYRYLDSLSTSVTFRRILIRYKDFERVRLAEESISLTDRQIIKSHKMIWASEAAMAIAVIFLIWRLVQTSKR